MYNTTAQGLAALGRNGDDTLLHVKQSELDGLRTLLGPTTTNPKTGMPEAFNWTDILTSVGIGLLGATTGGAALAAAPALGGLGAAAVGAGTGALAGGALSAAQGKGFAPGALGGAISGGMGGFGAEGMTNAAVPGTAVTQPQFAEAAKTVAAEPIYEGTAFATPTTGTIPGMSLETPGIGDALKQTAGSVFTKQGLLDLAKPVLTGAITGSGVAGTMAEMNADEAKAREAQRTNERNQVEQYSYFNSLGLPMVPQETMTSWSPNEQRAYTSNLIYGGMAAGGPVEMSRVLAGVPVKTTIPPHIVSQFEKTKKLNEVMNPALEQTGQNLREAAGIGSFAHGGYINNQPIMGDIYPQSQIPRAQSYAAAAPQRREVIGRAAGGLLVGDGDGMSDDIPADIEGMEDVRVADGEYVVPADMVKMIGKGDPEEGARILKQLLPMVRQAAHGKKTQVKQDAGKQAAAKVLKHG